MGARYAIAAIDATTARCASTGRPPPAWLLRENAIAVCRLSGPDQRAE